MKKIILAAPLVQCSNLFFFSTNYFPYNVVMLIILMGAEVGLYHYLTIGLMASSVKQ